MDVQNEKDAEGGGASREGGVENAEKDTTEGYRRRRRRKMRKRNWDDKMIEKDKADGRNRKRRRWKNM